MKIEGVESGLVTETVNLQRGGGSVLTLQITALPMGFMETAKDKIPGPVPRALDVMRKGGKVVRDENGKPIFTTNEDTPEFHKQEDAANRRQSTLMIVKGLENDPAVSFDAKLEDCKNDAEYADKMWTEIKDFGIAGGEYTSLLLRVLRVSGMTKEKLEAAREDFSFGD